MTATILDGKATSATIRAELAERVAKLATDGVVPGLATVLVGDDGPSHTYVNLKHKACAEIGMHSRRVELAEDATQATVEAAVRELNADPAIHGFLIQLPLPRGLDSGRLLELVDPAKDADGLHPTNLGRLVLQEPGPLPATPHACVVLLERYGVPIAGAEVCVVGRGVTVGRPLGLLLSRKASNGNATVTQCHTGTKDIAEHTRRADIVIAAVGVPGLLTADMVRPGAAVLDIGTTRVDGMTVGDVAAEVRDVAGYLAPIPGGVGPMTIAMLLTNVVEAAERFAAN